MFPLHFIKYYLEIHKQINISSNYTVTICLPEIVITTWRHLSSVVETIPEASFINSFSSTYLIFWYLITSGDNKKIRTKKQTIQKFIKEQLDRSIKYYVIWMYVQFIPSCCYTSIN